MNLSNNKANVYERNRRSKISKKISEAYVKSLGNKAKQIPGHSHYFVTKNGQVFSNIKRRELKWRISHGRAMVSVKDNFGKRKNYYVHRLVMLTYIGNSKLVVNHKDGNALNNNLNNLEYCTQSYNLEHSIKVLNRGWVKDGLHISAKLNRKQVLFVIKNNKKKNSELAALLNVDASIISNIRLGKQYRSITGIQRKQQC